MAARRCCNARRWRRWRGVARLSRPDVAARDAGDATADAWQVALRLRWPAAGGLAVAFIAVIAYLRVAPLGVTAELGSLARTAAFDAGWLPARLAGLDGFAGCATAVKQALLSNNGVFVLSLVAGAWAAALAAGRSSPGCRRRRRSAETSPAAC